MQAERRIKRSLNYAEAKPALAAKQQQYAPSFSLSAPCILLTLTHRLRFISNPYFDAPSCRKSFEKKELLLLMVLVVGVVCFAVHSVLETADTFAEPFHQFRDFAAAEEEQDDEAYQQEFLHADATNEQRYLQHLTCGLNGL